VSVVCVCVYVCVCVCVYVYVYVHVHVCICVYVYVSACLCLNLCHVCVMCMFLLVCVCRVISAVVSHISLALLTCSHARSRVFPLAMASCLCEVTGELFVSHGNSVHVLQTPYLRQKNVPTAADEPSRASNSKHISKSKTHSREVIGHPGIGRHKLRILALSVSATAQFVVAGCTRNRVLIFSRRDPSITD
jgi:hypothetical protein